MDTLSLHRTLATDDCRPSALWRAVFTSTVRDALGQFPDSVVPEGMTRAECAAEARRFLEHADEIPNSVVVECAGFDPGYVAIQARHLNWQLLELSPQCSSHRMAEFGTE